MTPSGLRYGAHLGGLDGVRDWLRGGDDESDGNTRISDYVRMGLRVPFEFTP